MRQDFVFSLPNSIPSYGLTTLLTCYPAGGHVGCLQGCSVSAAAAVSIRAPARGGRGPGVLVSSQGRDCWSLEAADAARFPGTGL